MVDFTKIDPSSAGGMKTIQDLYNMISGVDETTTGGTVTTTEGISQEGMNSMLQSALASTNGLAAVSQGQRNAGGYGSATNTQLTNDLMTRAAGEIARSNKTTVKSATPLTKTTGGITAKGGTKAVSFMAAMQGLGELNKSGMLDPFKKLFNRDGTDSVDTGGGVSDIQISGNNETGNPSFFSTAGPSVTGYADSGADASAGGGDYWASGDVSGGDGFVDYSMGDVFTDLGVDVGSANTGSWMGADDGNAMIDELLLFADGGEVSVNPRNRPSVLSASQFNKVVDPRAGKIGGGASENAVQREQGTPTNVGSNSPINATNIDRGDSSSSGAVTGQSNGDGGSLAGFVNDLSPSKIAQGARAIGKLTGNSALSTAGTIAGIATSANPVKAAALTAGNIATKGALKTGIDLYDTLKKPTIANVSDTILSVSNPTLAGVNGVLGFFGLPTIGEVAQNAKEMYISPNNPMSSSQQLEAESFRATLGQNVGENAPNVEPEPAAAVDVNGIVAAPIEAGGGGSGSSIDYTNNGDRGPGGSTGATGQDSYSEANNAPAGNFGSYNPGASYSHGGDVDGPGTGTSDSIPARLSDGETVITARTTQRVKELFGEDFFHNLEAQFNAPAAVKQKQMGRA